MTQNAPQCFETEGDPESLTDALQSQIAFYKGEYENLRLETKALIEDNAQLNDQLNSLLNRKYEYENIQSLRIADKEALEDLKRQLALSVKEKDSFIVLWQTAQKTVKSLEEELKVYQIYRNSTSLHADVDEVKREYSAVIKVFETKLKSNYEDMKANEKLLKEAVNEANNCRQMIENKDKRISEHLEKESKAKINHETLEKEIACLTNELSSHKRNSEDLLNGMELCRRNMDLYAKKESECRYKVAEALRVVDAAVSERDAAFAREKSAMDECTRASDQVTEILNESTQRVQKEIDLAKQGYNDKLNDMLIHIQRLELEMGEKNLSLERASRDCQMLEEDYERSRKGTTVCGEERGSRMLLLEQKLEATFQQLVLSERRNIQIVSEKESLQMDFDQMTSGFQRDKRRREWEEKLHSSEVNSLRLQISNLREALDEAHKLIQRLQSEAIVREQLQDTLAHDKLSATRELEKHFETQQKLNMKWKDSMKDITNKLQNRLEELSLENRKLKKDYSRLRSKCDIYKNSNFSVREIS